MLERSGHKSFDDASIDQKSNIRKVSRPTTAGRALPGSIFRRSRSNGYKSSPTNRKDSQKKSFDSQKVDLENIEVAKEEKNVQQKSVKESLSSSIANGTNNNTIKEGVTKNKNQHLEDNQSNIKKTSKTKQRSYNENQFERIITSSRINLADLRSLAWGGVPKEYRALVWKLLLGYAPSIEASRAAVIQKKRNEYYDVVKRFWDDVPDAARSSNEQMGLRQVLVDIPRTLPGVSLFKNQRIRDMMARVLYLYALRNPSTGYVQGFNELSCPFVLVYIGGYFNGCEVRGCSSKGDNLEDSETYISIDCVSDEILKEVEADTFHSLSILLSKIQTHYTEHQPGLQRNIVTLSKVIKRVDVPLHNHLQQEGMLYQQMCFRWFHNFLIRETSISNIIRMWDSYLSSVPLGFESFHLFVCAAIIVQDSQKLQSMRLEDMYLYIQEMDYNGEIDVLLSQAYVLSILFEGNEAHLE